MENGKATENIIKCFMTRSFILNSSQGGTRKIYGLIYQEGFPIRNSLELEIDERLASEIPEKRDHNQKQGNKHVSGKQGQFYYKQSVVLFFLK